MATSTTGHDIQLSARAFERISATVYDACGIMLPKGKEQLVRSRLLQRLRTLDLASFDVYADFVDSDKTRVELRTMIDLVTTNKTSFFRENNHFDYLRETVVPELVKNGDQVRIWSAGCSSGEEPTTIAMVLDQALPEAVRRRTKILATDISDRILEKARAGDYAPEMFESVPTAARSRYFESNQDGTWHVGSHLRSMITFARLNLLHEWPMKGPFDVIFCRNVMIYFDRPTQTRLVQRFRNLLREGGHLLIGHSESVDAAAVGLRQVMPATYVRA